MNVLRNRLITIAGLISASALGLVLACTKQSGPAQLQISMVDAPALDVDKIVVNVTKVTAHSSADGWVTILERRQDEPPLVVDLLTLRGADALKLGTVKLGAGRITQLRLYVTKTGNWVHVTGAPDTEQKELFVPSGYQSGIKIHGPWRVDACTLTSLTIDFDGLASILVHPTGQGDLWILRPVIRLKKADSSPVSCEDEGGGGTCDTGTSCAEGEVCRADGTCGPNVDGGAGSPCGDNSEYLSGTCGLDGKCEKSLPTGECRVSGDCTNVEPDSCTDGTCAPCDEDADCRAPLVCDTDPNSSTKGACVEPTDPTPGNL